MLNIDGDIEKKHGFWWFLSLMEPAWAAAIKF